MMTLSVPLAVIPSGTIMLTAAVIGYVYGLRGLGLAWPGFSLGLALVFYTARFASTHQGKHLEERQLEDGRSSCEGLATSTGDAEAAVAALPSWMQGKMTLALVRGVRKLLREQPKRTAVLLTF